MRLFPKPSSPVKSTKSIEFRGKHCDFFLLFLEFNLATSFRERKSAPPVEPSFSSGFKALKMPDFNKLHMQPKGIVEKSVTIPEEFQLESEKRRL